MMMNKKCSIIIIFSAVLCVAFLLSSIKTTPRPNILLITVDALRADHLGCYGYPRNTSPNIDKLAKEGVTFLNCFATGPGTVYSLVGLLTGRYLGTDKYEPFWDNVLDNKFTTLAEYLRKFGYRTTALLNNSIFQNGRGFQQGFDYFDAFSGKVGNELTTRAISLLNKPLKNKPIFIWMHYLEPHARYSFREPYFKDFEYDNLYKHNDKLLQLRPDNLKVKGYFPEFASRGYIPPVAFHKDRYNLNYYIACYDTEIFTADFYIGELLRNVRDDTLIILTADHGEYLGEHNIYFSHAEDIYDEGLHIPLIIKDNRNFIGGNKIPAVVSSVDIVPTILSMINPGWYFVNKNKFDGAGLKSTAKNKNLRRKYIYSYLPWAWSIRDVHENIKYILTQDGREKLYALPDEHNNLINDNSPKVASIRAELRNNLEAWLKAYPVRSDIRAKKISLDKNTQVDLRGLGYLQ